MNKNKKTMEAVVIGNKMHKTVVVETTNLIMHPEFKKYRHVKQKHKAHDENNECGVGDRVIIRETKPISKEKCWVVIKVVSKAAA